MKHFLPFLLIGLLLSACDNAGYVYAYPETAVPVNHYAGQFNAAQGAIDAQATLNAAEVHARATQNTWLEQQAQITRNAEATQHVFQATLLALEIQQAHATMTADEAARQIALQVTYAAGTAQAVQQSQKELQYTAQALEILGKQRQATLKAYQEAASLKITNEAVVLAAVRAERNADAMASFSRAFPWIVVLLVSVPLCAFVSIKWIQAYYRSAVIRETSYGLVSVRGRPQMLLSAGVQSHQPITDVDWIDAENLSGEAESFFDDNAAVGRLLYDSLRMPGLAQQARIPGWRELGWKSASNWDRAIKFLIAYGWIERRMVETGNIRRQAWHVAGSGTIATLFEAYRNNELEDFDDQTNDIPSPTAQADVIYA